MLPHAKYRKYKHYSLRKHMANIQRLKDRGLTYREIEYYLMGYSYIPYGYTQQQINNIQYGRSRNDYA